MSLVHDLILQLTSQHNPTVPSTFFGEGTLVVTRFRLLFVCSCTFFLYRSLLSNEPPQTQLLIPCTPAYLTFQTLIAPGSSLHSYQQNFPWNKDHLGQHDPLLSVGVASNPKFLWTTVLSSSAQRDALVVFRFWSDNRDGVIG
jgi:hypothetical protein